MDLWTVGTPARIETPQSSTLTGDIMPEIYDESAKFTLGLLRQSDVARFFCPQLLGNNTPALEKLLEEFDDETPPSTLHGRASSGGASGNSARRKVGEGIAGSRRW